MYTIVAAWYDVRTKENNPHNGDTENKFFCTSEHYFKSAELFFNKPFPMVIFTEPKWEAKVWEARPAHLHGITRVVVKDYEELNYWCHYKKFEENHPWTDEQLNRVDVDLEKHVNGINEENLQQELKL